MSSLISDRGSSICRGCGSSSLELILDLGLHPLPAEYASESKQVLDKFPLQLHICKECGLGQVGEYVFPERIFHSKYPYLSSASSTWVAHSRAFAQRMINELSLNEKTLVLELASNDGYLLSEFTKAGIPVLGVEPASNVAHMAIEKGVPTKIEFFGEQVAQNILEEYGTPSLIIANNVYAHIPDMIDFTKGLAVLCGDNTKISIENPSFMTLLQKGYFDTIYHEHYSYLTATSVSRVAENSGLKLSDVEQLPTHGGSNRYWLSRSDAISSSVTELISHEHKMGLFDSTFWFDFSSRVAKTLSDFEAWISERKSNEDIVVGYGAAHKGNTFLNSATNASKHLMYVVDASIEKQGKFLPGSQLPVIAPQQLGLASPTDVLILPWNIAPELAANIREIVPDARVWVAQPSMTLLN